MTTRTKRKIINWIMLISLIVVMGSGLLLKVMPGMWAGISHALSGFLLTITIVIHCFQHRPKRKVEKDVS